MLVVQHLLGEVVQTPYVFESNSLKRNHLCPLSQVICLFQAPLLLRHGPFCSLGKLHRFGVGVGHLVGRISLHWFAASQEVSVPRPLRAELSRGLQGRGSSEGTSQHAVCHSTLSLTACLAPLSLSPFQHPAFLC